MLSDLNNYSTDIPIVSIQGIENSPLMFRTIYQGWMAPVEADHLEYEDKGDDLEKDSRGLFKGVKQLVNLYQFLALVTPKYWLRTAKLAKANSRLEDALKWYRNSEAAWSFLMGAAGYEQVTVPVENVNLCEEEIADLEEQLENAMFNDTDIAPILSQLSQLSASSACFGTGEIVYYEHYSKPSDGSVVQSAMEYNGPTALNLTAPGAGHSESMNHPAVWGHIDKLVKGNLGDYNLPPTEEMAFLFFKID